MFSSYSEWDNSFTPQIDPDKFYGNSSLQTDPIEFYDNAYNDGEGGASNAGVNWPSGGSVYGKSGEYGETQPPPLEPFTSSDLFFAKSNVNSANMCHMFPTTTTTEEESFNLSDNLNVNHNNKPGLHYNNMNGQNHSKPLHYYHSDGNNFNKNNNNNVNNYNSHYNNYKETFCHNAINKTNQQGFQQQQQQPPAVYQKANFINNQLNNFASYSPFGNQQIQPPAALHQQQPVANQQFNFQPPPPHSRMSNYYYNLQHPQAPSQHYQQCNQVYQLPQIQQQSLTNCTKSIPCKGNQPWTYAYCYGYGPYSNQEPCKFTQVVDIEDFM